MICDPFTYSTLFVFGQMVGTALAPFIVGGFIFFSFFW